MRDTDGVTGGSFDAFVNGSKLDDMHPEFQPAQSKALLAGNMSKWLLWEGRRPHVSHARSDAEQNPSMAFSAHSTRISTTWRRITAMCGDPLLSWNGAEVAAAGRLPRLGNIHRV
jgi:hypothetical protein